MFELQAEHQTEEKGRSRFERTGRLLGRVLRNNNTVTEAALFPATPPKSAVVSSNDSAQPTGRPPGSIEGSMPISWERTPNSSQQVASTRETLDHASLRFGGTDAVEGLIWSDNH